MTQRRCACTADFCNQYARTRVRAYCSRNPIFLPAGNLTKPHSPSSALCWQDLAKLNITGAEGGPGEVVKSLHSTALTHLITQQEDLSKPVIAVLTKANTRGDLYA